MVNVTIKLTDQQWEQAYDRVNVDGTITSLIQTIVDRELARLFLERKDEE